MHTYACSACSLVAEQLPGCLGLHHVSFGSRKDELERVKAAGARVLTLEQLDGLRVRPHFSPAHPPGRPATLLPQQTSCGHLSRCCTGFQQG